MTMKNPEKKSSANTLKGCVMYFLPCPPSWMCTDESELKKGHTILPPTPRCRLHHGCRLPLSSASSSQLLLALRLGLHHSALLSWSISGRAKKPFPHLIISILHAAHSLATASVIHGMWSNTSVHPQKNVQFEGTHRMSFCSETVTVTLKQFVSLSVTNRKSDLFECHPQKVVFVESYPQKNLQVTELPTQSVVFDSMWRTQKCFASKLPTENRTLVIVWVYPQMWVSLKNAHRRARKAWGYHIWHLEN